MNRSNIRIKDIARFAGVSEGTVDRVIHNRREVSQETRSHVLAIIEKLDYTPNLIAKSLALKKRYKIAVFIPDGSKNNPYWEKPLIGITKAKEEIESFNGEVNTYFFDLNNRDSFIEEFRKIILTNPNGLIFSPMFYDTSLEVIRMCEENKIPYVFIDINIEGKNNLAYFGQDNLQSGLLAARLMHYALPDQSNIIILKMADREGTTHHLARREAGFRNFFVTGKTSKHFNISSLEIDLSGKDRVKGILTKNLNVILRAEGIFIPNSRAYKIAEFLDFKGISDILLVGYDLVEKNLHYLEKGIISFLIGQKPEEQGYKSVTSLFNFLFQGRKIEKVNHSPIEIIMKENIDYYRNLKF